MILFLNFAPIEFMGGAEKWMSETASFIGKTQKTLLVSVSQQLSNFYSKLVLHRNYDQRVPSITKNHLSLTLEHFLPWRKEFKAARKEFEKARKIYSRYEVLEMAILIYFGGPKILSKTISGIHFPLIYQTPIGFFQELHNFIYQSFISKWFLRKSLIVHVITPRDKELLEKDFKLKNVVYIPTSTSIKTMKPVARKSSKQLFILFVGELSFRKGADILRDILKDSPENFTFNIAGNGEMSEEIKEICESKDNCIYHGFVQGKELAKLYSLSDVLILPSRAEGFPLVFHEAMANGLVIVDSPQSRVGLDKNVEITTKNLSAKSFIKELSKISKIKFNKTNIQNYYQSNYSQDNINAQLKNFLFV